MLIRSSTPLKLTPAPTTVTAPHRTGQNLQSSLLIQDCPPPFHRKLFQAGGFISGGVPRKPVYHTKNHLQSKFIFSIHLKATQKLNKITWEGHSFPFLLLPHWKSAFLPSLKSKTNPGIKSKPESFMEWGRTVPWVEWCQEGQRFAIGSLRLATNPSATGQNSS